MRLIDADKLSYSNIKTNEYGYVETTKTVVLREDITSARTVSAIPILEGATNGDMIKIMFPDVKIQEIKGSFDKDKLLGYRTWLGGRSQDYLLEFWNAPYER